MPLISNIEVANFMNRERRTPYEPTWPHSQFPMLGLNSIINVPNGRGKTTIVKLVLFILAAKKRRIDELRKIHFAPKSSGSFTHVRVQMTIDTEEGASLDLFSGTPLGRQMVFGVYGYSGDNEEYTLYSYIGTFEDCPVQRLDSGNSKRFQLISDKEFKERLHSLPYRFPANERETSADAWRAHAEKWMDLSSIEQQIFYQLNAGGEGKSSYFDVEGRGADFARNVFYERLAPELLHDVMGGHGEEDEKKIEDTIHEKTRQVIHARLRNRDAAKSLELSKRVVEEIEKVCNIAEEMNSAAALCGDQRVKLSVEIGALRDLIVHRPIPGVPTQPPPELAEVAQYIVLCGGVPYIADRGIGMFSGEEPRVVNQRATRHGIQPNELVKSQLIEIACDHGESYVERKQGGGLTTKFYDCDSVISLLSRTETFLPDTDRDTAIAAVEAAFAWSTEHADTNPARVARKEYDNEYQKKTVELNEVLENVKDLQEERISLLKERTTFAGHQTEYQLMQESGLFSEMELGAPEETGRAVHEKARVAGSALEIHRQKVSSLQSVYREWQEFTGKYGVGVSPHDVLAVLESVEKEAMQNLSSLQSNRAELSLKGKSLKSATTEAREEFLRIRSRVERAENAAERAGSYNRWYEGESPEGLESAVRNELRLATADCNSLQKELASLKDRLSSIRQFRERFGLNADPASWLLKRLDLHQALMERRREVGNMVSVNSNDLCALENFSVAPGQFAQNVQDNVGVYFTPLHSAIETMSLDKARKESLLTLFSALLFAPVLPDSEAAETAALNLAQKGLEFPVFVRSDLEHFCAKGDITGGDGAARSLFIGVRTRNVECLLDPAYLEETKKLLRNEGDRLNSKLSLLDKAVARTAHTTTTAQLAERAKQAIESQAEESATAVEAQLGPLLASMERLEARASDEAVAAIKGMLDYTSALQGLSIEELSASLDTAKEQFETAEAAENLHEELLGQINVDIDAASDVARNAGIDKNRQEPVLKRIDGFMTDKEYGPDFIERAGILDEQLNGELEKAELKTRFRFDQAQKFVETGFDRFNQIESRLLVIEEVEPGLSEKKVQLSKRVEELRESILKSNSGVVKIDTVVRRLIRVYRNHRMDGLPDVDLSNNPLFREGSYLRNSDNVDAYVKHTNRLESDIDEAEDRIRDIAKELEAANNRHASAVKDYDRQIERSANDESLKLEEHVIQLLLKAKDNLSYAKRVLSASIANYERDLAANQVAREQLDVEWANISNWLAQFTRRLPSNLDLMKSRFAPKKDQSGNLVSAGFVINATAIGHEDIEDVLHEIVRDIEEYEESRYLQTHTDVKRDAQNSFRREIRKKFYQRVLLEPNIKVFIPSISKVKAIQLDRDIASSGQSVAISLLWIVKMSDFVTERERSHNTISMSLAAKKKLRAIKSQFVFIDGAFSHLSDRALIDDVLGEIANSRGKFQLIVTGHQSDFKPNWQIFPTMLCGREVGGKYVFVDQQKPVEPGTVGSRIGAMSMIRTHVIKPEVTVGPEAH